ncbi:MAG: hypothetical protein AAFX86_05230 [Pseudomonadota bacterium]
MLIALAITLLVISGLLLFAWPMVWALPGQRLKTLAGPETRFLAGTLGTIVMVVSLGPTLAVMSQPGAGAVLAAFEATLTMTFSL